MKNPKYECVKTFHDGHKIYDSDHMKTSRVSINESEKPRTMHV